MKKPPPPETDGSFDRRLENDPGFQKRIEQARRSLRAGKGVRLEDVKPEIAT